MIHDFYVYTFAFVLSAQVCHVNFHLLVLYMLFFVLMTYPNVTQMSAELSLPFL